MDRFRESLVGNFGLGLLIGVSARAWPLYGIHSVCCRLPFIMSRWAGMGLAHSHLCGGSLLGSNFRHFWCAFRTPLAPPTFAGRLSIGAQKGRAKDAVGHCPFQPPRLVGCSGRNCTDLSATLLRAVCFGIRTFRGRSRCADSDSSGDRRLVSNEATSKGIMTGCFRPCCFHQGWLMISSPMIFAFHLWA